MTTSELEEHRRLVRAVRYAAAQGMSGDWAITSLEQAKARIGDALGSLDMILELATRLEQKSPSKCLSDSEAGREKDENSRLLTLCRQRYKRNYLFATEPRCLQWLVTDVSQKAAGKRLWKYIMELPTGIADFLASVECIDVQDASMDDAVGTITRVAMATVATEQTDLAIV